MTATDIFTEAPAAAKRESRELRVLSGRARGAAAALEIGRQVEIGYAFSNDIVVRDPGAKGVRLRLRATDDTAALEVLEGEVELLGHAMSAPASAILPAYVPLMIGDSAIAIGAPGAERWADAAQLLRAARPEAAEAEPAEAAAGERLPPWRLLSGATAAWPKVERFLPIALGGAALALMVGGVQAARPLLQFPVSAERTDKVLTEAGFTSLTVDKRSDGRLAVHGYLPTEADQAKLQSLVESRDLPAVVEVQTGDGLARGVEDVFRSNGLEAQATAGGPGVVAVQVRRGDLMKQEEVKALALRDVRGLKRLTVDSRMAAGEAEAPSLSSDAGKRVTAVIGGEVGYVETADGSRYFPGAILPTGHKIVGIAENDVALEKNGQTSHLKF